MSEEEYPEAWGVLCEEVEPGDGPYWYAIRFTEEGAEEYASDQLEKWNVVRLVPQPVVDRMIAEAVAKAERRPENETWILLTDHRRLVAEAVAAERKRCQLIAVEVRSEAFNRGAGMLVSHGPGNAPCMRANPEQDGRVEAATEILQAIESGHEPGEGGA